MWGRGRQEGWQLKNLHNPSCWSRGPAEGGLVRPILTQSLPHPPPTPPFQKGKTLLQNTQSMYGSCHPHIHAACFCVCQSEKEKEKQHGSGKTLSSDQHVCHLNRKVLQNNIKKWHSYIRQYFMCDWSISFYRFVLYFYHFCMGWIRLTFVSSSISPNIYFWLLSRSQLYQTPIHCAKDRYISINYENISRVFPFCVIVKP